MHTAELIYKYGIKGFSTEKYEKIFPITSSKRVSILPPFFPSIILLTNLSIILTINQLIGFLKIACSADF